MRANILRFSLPLCLIPHSYKMVGAAPTTTSVFQQDERKEATSVSGKKPSFKKCNGRLLPVSAGHLPTLAGVLCKKREREMGAG